MRIAYNKWKGRASKVKTTPFSRRDRNRPGREL